MFFDVLRLVCIQNAEALVRNNFSSVGFLVQNVFDSLKASCFCSWYVFRSCWNLRAARRWAIEYAMISIV